MLFLKISHFEIVLNFSSQLFFIISKYFLSKIDIHRYPCLDSTWKRPRASFPKPLPKKVIIHSLTLFVANIPKIIWPINHFCLFQSPRFSTLWTLWYFQDSLPTNVWPGANGSARSYCFSDDWHEISEIISVKVESWDADNDGCWLRPFAESLSAPSACWPIPNSIKAHPDITNYSSLATVNLLNYSTH